MCTHRSFLFRGLDLAPLLDRLCQVDAIHGQFDLPDLIVFGEAIEVIDREDQSLGHDFIVRDFEVEGLVEDRVQSLSVDLRLELFLLVRQEVDFAVGVTRASSITGREILSLDHRHRQLRVKEEQVLISFLAQTDTWYTRDREANILTFVELKS